MTTVNTTSIRPTPTHRLKTTDERVIAIHFEKYNDQDYATCILPPQAPGHRSRRAHIHMDKLLPLAGSRS